jgi:hypothetical protein
MIYRDIRTKPTTIKSYSRLAPPCTSHPIDVVIAHARLVDETKANVGTRGTMRKSLTHVKILIILNTYAMEKFPTLPVRCSARYPISTHLPPIAVRLRASRSSQALSIVRMKDIQMSMPVVYSISNSPPRPLVSAGLRCGATRPEMSLGTLNRVIFSKSEVDMSCSIVLEIVFVST